MNEEEWAERREYELAKEFLRKAHELLGKNYAVTLAVLGAVFAEQPARDELEEIPEEIRTRRFEA